ncbi:MAG TPA: aldo/keto reductase [Thermoanaerobaculia bacterium]|nr:aldo/keto reductase [Thermoanaerobaculia bacterium]
MSSREGGPDRPPSFLYGTAWKEDATERLVRLALDAGFRGIDTANQRRHYFEAGAGAAIKSAIADGVVRREDLFLQTKFTYRDGQDHRLPYDPDADLTTQVQQSFASSLEHLGVDTIDSYVLHGPSRRRGLAPADIEVWRAMESLHDSGATRHLGVSNIAIDQLEALFATARVRPSFLQNRCFARTAWDLEVRAFCAANDVIYQGFSLLTANVNELRNAAFRRIVERVGRTSAQVVFRFARQIGMLPLTGTTDPAHMREDLAIDDFSLSSDEIRTIERIAV